MTPASKNVMWFDGYLTRDEREKLHGHMGAVIWFTGLSASGKSTIREPWQASSKISPELQPPTKRLRTHL
jgi:adenylylsulfate kinase-like enzyme